MKLITICNRIIEYSFYTLFFLVPLVFAGDTFELFEFNKMWITFAITIVIGAAWAVKMVIQRGIRIQRTLLDIPILLFLASQIISTIFSIDRHISVWGYYSRFNGGLLSIVSYIFLYYAFVSNFEWGARGDTTGKAPDSAHALFGTNTSGALAGGKVGAGPRAIDVANRLLKVALASGVAVALWGLPSHFGYDPTCLLFRGTLDVSCWTEAFQPKVRMFSTLGQPNWLAAYLAVLIPLAITFFLKAISDKQQEIRNKKGMLFAFYFLLIAFLFYADLLYTSSQSGFLGAWVGIFVFGALTFWRGVKSEKPKNSYLLKFLIPILAIFLILTFFQGHSLATLKKFTYQGLKESLTVKTQDTAKSNAPAGPALEVGGTDSGKIRKIVWTGALDIWKANPFFGTGVETFAYAYYKHRPVEHNLTSEWDYLYNKAHNEYLNYLATTGALGLFSYLWMIGLFVWITLRRIYKMSLLSLALIAGYASILVSNFFGFSVVIINLFLFLIPAFVLILENLFTQKELVFPKGNTLGTSHISNMQWVMIFFVSLFGIFSLYTLLRFWNADKAYALGYNLGRVGEYQTGYPKTLEAVILRGGEPVFKDELSVQSAMLAFAVLTQEGAEKDSQTASTAARFAQQAIVASDDVVRKSPNNVSFWKTRTRVFYTLSQVDERYLPFALSAIKKASELAPSDAKVLYNLGVLYGQNNKIDNAIKTLEHVVKIKPDYRDAYFALGLFYREKATDGKTSIIFPEFEKKAVSSMRHILDHIASDDAQIIQTLKSWKEI